MLIPAHPRAVRSCASRPSRACARNKGAARSIRTIDWSMSPAAYAANARSCVREASPSSRAAASRTPFDIRSAASTGAATERISSARGSGSSPAIWATASMTRAFATTPGSVHQQRRAAPCRRFSAKFRSPWAAASPATATSFVIACGSPGTPSWKISRSHVIRATSCAVRSNRAAASSRRPTAEGSPS